VFLRNWVVSVVNLGSLTATRCRFFDEPLDAFDDLFGDGYRLNDCFTLFFVDFDLRPGSEPKPLSYLLREDDPSLWVDFRHVPT